MIEAVKKHPKFLGCLIKDMLKIVWGKVWNEKMESLRRRWIISWVDNHKSFDTKRLK